MKCLQILSGKEIPKKIDPDPADPGGQSHTGKSHGGGKQTGQNHTDGNMSGGAQNREIYFSTTVEITGQSAAPEVKDIEHGHKPQVAYGGSQTGKVLGGKDQCKGGTGAENHKQRHYKAKTK